MQGVNLDVNKDVEHLDAGGAVHGDEARVAVVHHQFTACNEFSAMIVDLPVFSNKTIIGERPK